MSQGSIPPGRLDYDSEGLLLLTNSGALQSRIADPVFKLSKHYWVQVEGPITTKQLNQLSGGVELRDGVTLPAKAHSIQAPAGLWARTPEVTPHRANNSSWLALEIREGKNRQVRRMCAHVGLPVLRLIRHQIAHWSLQNLKPGQFRKETVNLPQEQQSRRSHVPQPHSRKKPRNK